LLTTIIRTACAPVKITAILKAAEGNNKRKHAKDANLVSLVFRLTPQPQARISKTTEN
jgi:hypothetical protein